MSDQITDRPADPERVPQRPSPPEPDEDVPPRRHPLSAWSPKNIAIATAFSGLIGFFLLMVANAFLPGGWPVRWLVVGAAFLAGAAGGFLIVWRSIRRQIGRGVRTSARELPRGAPARPSLPSTAIRAALPPTLPVRFAARLVGDHHGRVTAVAVSPDGRFALTATRDTSVGLWDVQTGFELLAFGGFKAAVNAVTFSPDGRLVVAAGQDAWGNRNKAAEGVVRIWDASNGQELRRFEIEGPLYSLAFLPDGRRVVVGGMDFLRLWEIDGPSPLAMVRLQRGLVSVEEIRAVAVSPEGDLCVAGCHLTQDARLVNLGRAEEVRSLEGHRMNFSIYRLGAVVSAAFDAEGMRIVTGSWDQTARVWNLAGKELTRFEGHRGWWGWRGVVGVAWIGRHRVLSVSENGLLCVWDAETGEELSRYHHGGGVTSLAVTPDGKLALTGGRDGIVRVWEF